MSRVSCVLRARRSLSHALGPPLGPPLSALHTANCPLGRMEATDAASGISVAENCVHSLTVVTALLIFCGSVRGGMKSGWEMEVNY